MLQVIVGHWLPAVKPHHPVSIALGPHHPDYYFNTDQTSEIPPWMKIAHWRIAFCPFSFMAGKGSDLLFSSGQSLTGGSTGNGWPWWKHGHRSQRSSSGDRLKGPRSALQAFKPLLSRRIPQEHRPEASPLGGPSAGGCCSGPRGRRFRGPAPSQVQKLQAGNRVRGSINHRLEPSEYVWKAVCGDSKDFFLEGCS